MSLPKPQIGARYGRLLVLARNEDVIQGRNPPKFFAAWLCRCDCGVEKVVLQGSLRSGRSQSCGCLKKELVGARWKQLRAEGRISQAGPKSNFWKGGRRVDARGYVERWIAKDDPLFAMARSHTGAGGYVFEHRLVMAQYLGRPLESFEEVHHIDGDRQNNQLENLQLRITAHGAGIVLRCRKCHSLDLESQPIANAHNPG